MRWPPTRRGRTDYAEQYCTLPGGECWSWFATAYGNGQWISFAIQDRALDPTGDAVEEAERFDWPIASVSFSYGATVIAAGMRDGVRGCLRAVRRASSMPAPTTSD